MNFEKHNFKPDKNCVYRQIITLLMAIGYNFDNSEKTKETLKKVSCPICSQGRQSNIMDIFDCSQCGSQLQCDKNFSVIIKHNNVKLKISNLIGGVFTLLLILGYFFVYQICNSKDLLLIGITFVIIHFGIWIKLYSWNQTQFQGFIDIHNALIGFRIKHYDWGSKIFITAIIILQIISVFFIVSNL